MLLCVSRRWRCKLGHRRLLRQTRSTLATEPKILGIGRATTWAQLRYPRATHAAEAHPLWNVKAALWAPHSQSLGRKQGTPATRRALREPSTRSLQHLQRSLEAVSHLLQNQHRHFSVVSQFAEELPAREHHAPGGFNSNHRCSTWLIVQDGELPKKSVGPNSLTTALLPSVRVCTASALPEVTM